MTAITCQMTIDNLLEIYMDAESNVSLSIRGQRVMLDRDLAEMYGVETRVLNQAVKRNKDRFPPDFMFQLTLDEWQLMSSQFVTTSTRKRPKSSLPYVFTEHGTIMLAATLKSDIAIHVSIMITRAFVAMRKFISTPLPDKIDKLERQLNDMERQVEEILADQNEINEDTRMQLDAISLALAELQAKPPVKQERKPIGFIQPDDKK